VAGGYRIEPKIEPAGSTAASTKELNHTKKSVDESEQGAGSPRVGVDAAVRRVFKLSAEQRVSQACENHHEVSDNSQRGVFKWPSLPATAAEPGDVSAEQIDAAQVGRSQDELNISSVDPFSDMSSTSAMDPAATVPGNVDPFSDMSSTSAMDQAATVLDEGFGVQSELSADMNKTVRSVGVGPDVEELKALFEGVTLRCEVGCQSVPAAAAAVDNGGAASAAKAEPAEKPRRLSEFELVRASLTPPKTTPRARVSDAGITPETSELARAFARIGHDAGATNENLNGNANTSFGADSRVECFYIGDTPKIFKNNWSKTCACELAPGGRGDRECHCLVGLWKPTLAQKVMTGWRGVKKSRTLLDECRGLMSSCSLRNTPVKDPLSADESELNGSRDRVSRRSLGG
jgi:hypothetical protein